MANPGFPTLASSTPMSVSMSNEHNFSAAAQVVHEQIGLRPLRQPSATATSTHTGEQPRQPPPPPPVKKRTVVHVENANKVYGKGDNARQVLRDLCMNVEENTIYGLLGSSGCGKTTILSCIVALRKLTSGTILICGQPTGSRQSGIPGKKVGYMPQETAMNGEFTITEVLAYFGRIYGMSGSEIKLRTKRLLNLLDLDGMKQQIDDLSEGQKRRVSMAVALVHQPDLLILDEPTVGLDPLLRDNIWAHLHNLVAQNSTTIIVTTHYIEEMRRAHMVGIMRSGHLLCEDSPSKLLEIYNERLLDTVVVKLCKQDERPALNGSSNDDNVGGQFGRENGRQVVVVPVTPSTTVNAGAYGAAAALRPQQRRGGGGGNSAARTRAEWKHIAAANTDGSVTSFRHRLRALLVKDFLILLRNFGFYLFLILAPPLSVTVFAGLDAQFNNLKLGVVNFETDLCPPMTMSQDSYDVLMGEHKYNGSLNGDCFSVVPDLTCWYLDILKENRLKLVSFDTIEDAHDEALQAKLNGYIWFDEDFTSHFYNRIVLNDLSLNGTLDGSRISTRLDGSEATINQFLHNTLVEAFQTMSRKLFVMCGMDVSGKKQPIQYGAPIFQHASNRLAYMTTGTALAYTFILLGAQCGLTYIVERKDGMLNRIMVAGVEKIEIIFSQCIVQFCVCLAQILGCFILIHVILDIGSNGSIPLAFALMATSLIVAISLGFLLATYCSNEKNAILCSVGMVAPCYISAGLAWPIENLPIIWQKLGGLLPYTIPAEAYRSITIRGFGIDDEVVWMGFAISGCWIVIIWTLIFVFHKFGQRNE